MRNTLALVLTTWFISFALPYNDIVPKHDPLHGLVTARNVVEPSRANLDLAAWVDNPLFVSPGVQDSSLPKKSKVDWKSCSVVVKSVSKLSQTNLPKSVIDRPFSFMAVKRSLDLELGMRSWGSIYSEIVKYATGTPQRVFLDLGKPPVLWIEYTSGGKSEFLQIRSGLWADSLSKLEAWFASYKKPLQPQEILEWATQTASYWYPSLNTDLVWDLPDSSWPGEIVEAPVRKFMGKARVTTPTIVIRGNPLGTPHYTVIQIPGLKPLAQRGSSTSENDVFSSQQKMADRQLPVNYVRNLERVQAELEAHGGSFSSWDSSLSSWKSKLKKILDSIPPTQMGLEGKGNWLFFRRALAAILAGDPEAQNGTTAPLPPLISFKGKLEEAEVNMLFVPVPTKVEVYGDYMVDGLPLPSDGIINPWGRKFIVDAQQEGMEVIDLLPPFLDARKQDKTNGEPVFQKEDTHWTRRGMLVAAQVLAERIRQYSWYKELNPSASRFQVRDTTYMRLGDIVERLPTDRQGQYAASKLAGTRVFVHDTVPYQGPKGAPIILIGDSFTGVMESVDCKNGGIGSHIARLTGLDVEVITSWGGGPNVRAKFLKARKAQLAQARLVIYMMTARDLWDYPGGWDALEGL